MAFDSWLSCPKVVLPLVRKTFNGIIEFDPASNRVAQHYVQAKHYAIAPFDFDQARVGVPDGVCHIDGLSTQWRGRTVFCNPPYSAGAIDKFSEKGILEWNESARREWQDPIEQMVFLVNSATDARWYHNLLNNCSVALLWRGRIKFWKIFDGEAHEKWEGQLSKERGAGKIGNFPRYLNTLFFWGREQKHVQGFIDVFNDKGTIIKVV